MCRACGAGVSSGCVRGRRHGLRAARPARGRRRAGHIPEKVFETPRVARDVPVHEGDADARRRGPRGAISRPIPTCPPTRGSGRCSRRPAAAPGRAACMTRSGSAGGSAADAATGLASNEYGPGVGKPQAQAPGKRPAVSSGHRRAAQRAPSIPRTARRVTRASPPLINFSTRGRLTPPPSGSVRSTPPAAALAADAVPAPGHPSRTKDLHHVAPRPRRGIQPLLAPSPSPRCPSPPSPPAPHRTASHSCPAPRR